MRHAGKIVSAQDGFSKEPERKAEAEKRKGRPTGKQKRS